MRNKQAAMRMAISTIILLVVAIVLLGVIISSFVGLFNPTTEELTNLLESMDLEYKASYNDPLVGADAYYAKKGNNLIAASFYNKDNPECETKTVFNFLCPGGFSTTNTPIVSSVSIGEEKTIGTILKLNYAMPKGEYVCLIKVKCGACTTSDECSIEAYQHTIFKVK